MATKHRMIELETGRIVVSHIEVAKTLWQRTVGLLGRTHLAPNHGFWIEPCNSIHTYGMKFTLDALFLDRQGAVVHIVEQLEPWKIAGPIRRAKVVVELPAGAVQQLSIAPNFRYLLK